MKSEHAVVSVPELELEIPPSGKRSELTTVEGVLQRTKDNLQMDQAQRQQIDPQSAVAIDAFLAKLDEALAGQMVRQ